jgi:hypothetical protein
MLSVFGLGSRLVTADVATASRGQRESRRVLDNPANVELPATAQPPENDSSPRAHVERSWNIPPKPPLTDRF